MDRSVNRIELRGNVGQDPKITVVGENTVIKFNMATNETIKDKSGNYKKETTWHTIVAWAGKGMPDFKSIVKGSCVSVTGRLRCNKYTTQDGEDRIYYDVLAYRLVAEDINIM